jgi:menaquinone-dependent protoporphyrinogen IX oxidase
MKTIAVIYKSHYGSTKIYAEWIAQELHADLFERNSFSANTLKNYDCVIFGGGLYASGIIGSDLVAKNPCSNLVVFTVGLSDPTHTDYSGILHKAFPKPDCQPIHVFHLRGAIYYSKLNFLHRNMMRMLKKTVEKKPQAERSEEDNQMLATYGKDVNFMKKEAIRPILDCVKRF